MLSFIFSRVNRQKFCHLSSSCRERNDEMKTNLLWRNLRRVSPVVVGGKIMAENVRDDDDDDDEPPHGPDQRW